MTLESIIKEYKSYKDGQGNDTTVFCYNCSDYSSLWEFMENSSASFKDWDLIVIRNWYFTSKTDSGPRLAFREWNDKQTRFDFEEFHAVANQDWSCRAFVVFSSNSITENNSDYYEWSD